MTFTYKVLAQSNPSALTLTDAYTVPALTQVIGSTLFVCNRSNVATAFRLAIAVAGAADDPSQYLFYDSPLAGNETLPFTNGLTLDTTDVLRVYATDATITFTFCGTEVTA